MASCGILSLRLNSLYHGMNFSRGIHEGTPPTIDHCPYFTLMSVTDRTHEHGGYMWLCSKEGFFSVVQKEDSDRLDVRARVRADLVALSTQYLGNPQPMIYTFPNADYEYRIFLTHEEWANVRVTSPRPAAQ